MSVYYRLQLTSINKIEVLKSKKSIIVDVFEVESCMQGHHIYIYAYYAY